MRLTYQTGSGHLDTSLSLVEIWLALVYSDFYQYDPADGGWAERDRIFLSEGHACPIQYIVNAELGYYPFQELFETNRRPDSHFQGHTKRNLAYGFENSNGSLGIGLWQAYGHAVETDRYVFCIAGDGEFQEPISMGLFSAPHNFRPAGNFILILNHNQLAQDSKVDIGPLEDVARLYRWQVQRLDGHDLNALAQTYRSAIDETDRPSLIICETEKGRGGDPQWAGKLGRHGRPPKTEDEFQAYLDGLETSRRI